jgi:hypothetical protein
VPAGGYATHDPAGTAANMAIWRRCFDDRQMLFYILIGRLKMITVSFEPTAIAPAYGICIRDGSPSKTRVPGALKVCALSEASCFPDEQGVGCHEGVRARHARPFDRPA